ncbi:MAG: hypothetical protein JXA94_05910 [Parachlamydiales bacterium]|nr:hypothetical protein [Parachlamydiales bacterium]
MGLCTCLDIGKLLGCDFNCNFRSCTCCATVQVIVEDDRHGIRGREVIAGYGDLYSSIADGERGEVRTRKVLAHALSDVEHEVRLKGILRFGRNCSADLSDTKRPSEEGAERFKLAVYLSGVDLDQKVSFDDKQQIVDVEPLVKEEMDKIQKKVDLVYQYGSFAAGLWDKYTDLTNGQRPVKLQSRIEDACAVKTISKQVGSFFLDLAKKNKKFDSIQRFCDLSLGDQKTFLEAAKKIKDLSAGIFTRCFYTIDEVREFYPTIRGEEKPLFIHWTYTKERMEKALQAPTIGEAFQFDTRRDDEDFRAMDRATEGYRVIDPPGALVEGGGAGLFVKEEEAAGAIDDPIGLKAAPPLQRFDSLAALPSGTSSPVAKVVEVDISEPGPIEEFKVESHGMTYGVFIEFLSKNLPADLKTHYGDRRLQLICQLHGFSYEDIKRGDSSFLSQLLEIEEKINELTRISSAIFYLFATLKKDKDLPAKIKFYNKMRRDADYLKVKTEIGKEKELSDLNMEGWLFLYKYAQEYTSEEIDAFNKEYCLNDWLNGMSKAQKDEAYFIQMLNGNSTDPRLIELGRKRLRIVCDLESIDINRVKTHRINLVETHSLEKRAQELNKYSSVFGYLFAAFKDSLTQPSETRDDYLNQRNTGWRIRFISELKEKDELYKYVESSKDLLNIDNKFFLQLYPFAIRYADKTLEKLNRNYPLETWASSR